jgi:hypothetical protein
VYLKQHILQYFNVFGGPDVVSALKAQTDARLKQAAPLETE